MHVDEIETDAALAARLIERQFPRWAGLPVVPVASHGTDHAIYRVGEFLAARLPRIGWAVDQVRKEAQWLPRLAPQLPLAVPAPLATGEPADGYPFPWAVHEWLPGEAAVGRVEDPQQTAIDLAHFVRALRAIDTTGAPTPSHGARGRPLVELDDAVRRALTDLGNRIDGRAALRSWEESVAAPAYGGAPAWFHGDLLPGNLLVRHGRLAAVIDFGSLAVGDPACDLQPAWHLFDGIGRDRFLEDIGADDAARLRGRGWVLAQCVIALPYYWETNPGIVRQSQRALGAVLADVGTSA